MKVHRDARDSKQLVLESTIDVIKINGHQIWWSVLEIIIANALKFVNANSSLQIKKKDNLIC